MCKHNPDPLEDGGGKKFKMQEKEYKQNAKRNSYQVPTMLSKGDL